MLARKGAFCWSMASVSRPRQRPRRPLNGLHKAAFLGSTKCLVGLLSSGWIDIEQGDSKGCTPLMIASSRGHSQAVRILLNKGANVSAVADDGGTPLHFSAQDGHLAITKMLVKAGADLEAAISDQGATPLHVAANRGHSEVMSVLIDAGANPDSRRLDGVTPLFMVAQDGHNDAVKVLLRAKANPLLSWAGIGSGVLAAPLDVAAERGHSGVVRELVQQVGIEGCGGASGGLQALSMAASRHHLDIMALLTDAGVVDTGSVLLDAVGYGREASVKFLLQQRKGDEAAYVNYRDGLGIPILLHAIGLTEVPIPPPRIVRLLVDAGVDTTLAVRTTNTEGEVVFNGTPLAIVSSMLRAKVVGGKQGATKGQFHKLERIRRLLSRVEAVHAISLLWPVDIPPMIGATEKGIPTASRRVAASTPLTRMLPILRRRAKRPAVVLAALSRWVVRWYCVHDLWHGSFVEEERDRDDVSVAAAVTGLFDRCWTRRQE